MTAKPHAIHILDVFAESPLSGNQLGVVEAAGDLSTDEMQAIALETNFSETTFITGPKQADGGFPVRIFTPAAELPFAGHPTLGTAWLIRNRLLSNRPDEVRLNLGVGQVPVTFEAQISNRAAAALSASSRASQSQRSEAGSSAGSTGGSTPPPSFETACRPRSRAGRRSVWDWLAPWPPRPTSCFSTSLSALSTP